MSIGPIGDPGDPSTAIGQQIQAQQARLLDRANQTDATQQATLERQDERQAQLEAELAARQRIDDRQAALQAFGIQRAQLQDAILADQDLQAVQETRADQVAADQRSFDQTALDALLNNNGNSTIATVQDALDEFGQFDEADQLPVAQAQVTLTSSTGSDVDTQL
ncbi:hypothetical protein [Kineosporia mesophila]|nr:hypothetical protein [Kineosporia mesophila]MCD5351243.1 hypothetical protein [Kineosporia mesophila]